MDMGAKRANGDMMGMAYHTGQCFVEDVSRLIWEFKIRHGCSGEDRRGLCGIIDH